MKRQRTDTAVVHYSASPQAHSESTALRIIRAAHKKPRPGLPNGLAYDGFMAYHKVIGHNFVANGRPVDTVGYHAGNLDINKRSVGVCLILNVGEHPNDYQKRELGKVLKAWQEQFGIKRDRIMLHREIKPTACPGTVSQALITTIMSTDDCAKYKKLDKERVAQIKRLQKESRELTAEVHEANGVIKDFENVALPAAQREVENMKKAKDEWRQEANRKENIILEKEERIAELERAVNDASDNAEENLKQRLATRIWDWLFRSDK